MANSASDQNQQNQINAQELKADDLKKQSRRSWLRSATAMATSAIVLLFVLSGCTKEHWDDVVGKLPDLGGSEPGVWYNLRVTYKDEDGNTRTGYLGPVGQNAATSFWDYMRVDGGQSKFKLHQTEDGWAYWEIDDGNWLSLKATGWAYRSLESNRIEWKIVDGKLYNRYWASDWQSHPLGAARSSFLVSDAYYAGVDLGDDKVLTDCELVLAP
jgi:hypothetical protein